MMGLIVFLLWLGAFAAIANPKTQEIFNRGWWWRIPAMVALVALVVPLVNVIS